MIATARKRKIAVVIVDRANYGRLKPVMTAIKENPALEMQVICAGTMVLERFGSPVKIVERDGFPVSSEVFIELEGSTPTTMAKSVGFAVIEFASEFQRLKPDVVLIIGDRYEALAATLAASYMNLCVAHIQGGEVSGSIDESARHCITKLSHYHFPATDRAAEYIVKMGESKETVFKVGCPSGDIALRKEHKATRELLNSHGSGAEIDPAKPFLLVVFHPVTTEFGDERRETEMLLSALERIKTPTVWLWPNIDAGSDHISKSLRAYRQQDGDHWIRFVKNFSPEDYLKVLASASCAVGNSSSFVRDSSFLGTPVVLVGDRQQGREVSQNLSVTDMSENAIYETVAKQLKHGRYAPSHLYGDGEASQKIARLLTEVPIYVQKRLAYPG